jgi:hypothetical protein
MIGVAFQERQEIIGLLRAQISGSYKESFRKLILSRLASIFEMSSFLLLPGIENIIKKNSFFCSFPSLYVFSNSLFFGSGKSFKIV